MSGEDRRKFIEEVVKTFWKLKLEAQQRESARDGLEEVQRTINNRIAHLETALRQNLILQKLASVEVRLKKLEKQRNDLGGSSQQRQGKKLGATTTRTELSPTNSEHRGSVTNFSKPGISVQFNPEANKLQNEIKGNGIPSTSISTTTFDDAMSFKTLFRAKETPPESENISFVLLTHGTPDDICDTSKSTLQHTTGSRATNTSNILQHNSSRNDQNKLENDLHTSSKENGEKSVTASMFGNHASPLKIDTQFLPDSVCDISKTVNPIGLRSCEIKLVISVGSPYETTGSFKYTSTNQDPFSTDSSLYGILKHDIETKKLNQLQNDQQKRSQNEEKRYGAGTSTSPLSVHTWNLVNPVNDDSNPESILAIGVLPDDISSVFYGVSWPGSSKSTFTDHDSVITHAVSGTSENLSPSEKQGKEKNDQQSSNKQHELKSSTTGGIGSPKSAISIHTSDVQDSISDLCSSENLSSVGLRSYKTHPVFNDVHLNEKCWSCQSSLSQKDNVFSGSVESISSEYYNNRESDNHINVQKDQNAITRKKEISGDNTVGTGTSESLVGNPSTLKLNINSTASMLERVPNTRFQSKEKSTILQDTTSHSEPKGLKNILDNKSVSGHTAVTNISDRYTPTAPQNKRRNVRQMCSRKSKLRSGNISSEFKSSSIPMIINVHSNITSPEHVSSISIQPHTSLTQRESEPKLSNDSTTSKHIITTKKCNQFTNGPQIQESKNNTSGSSKTGLETSILLGVTTSTAHIFNSNDTISDPSIDVGPNEFTNVFLDSFLSETPRSPQSASRHEHESYTSKMFERSGNYAPTEENTKDNRSKEVSEGSSLDLGVCVSALDIPSHSSHTLISNISKPQRIQFNGDSILGYTDTISIETSNSRPLGTQHPSTERGPIATSVISGSEHYDHKDLVKKHNSQLNLHVTGDTGKHKGSRGDESVDVENPLSSLSVSESSQNIPNYKSSNQERISSGTLRLYETTTNTKHQSSCDTQYSSREDEPSTNIRSGLFSTAEKATDSSINIFKNEFCKAFSPSFGLAQVDSGSDGSDTSPDFVALKECKNGNATSGTNFGPCASHSSRPNSPSNLKTTFNEAGRERTTTVLESSLTNSKTRTGINLVSNDLKCGKFPTTSEILQSISNSTSAHTIRSEESSFFDRHDSPDTFIEKKSIQQNHDTDICRKLNVGRTLKNNIYSFYKQLFEILNDDLQLKLFRNTAEKEKNIKYKQFKFLKKCKHDDMIPSIREINLTVAAMFETSQAEPSLHSSMSSESTHIDQTSGSTSTSSLSRHHLQSRVDELEKRMKSLEKTLKQDHFDTRLSRLEKHLEVLRDRRSGSNSEGVELSNAQQLPHASKSRKAKRRDSRTNESTTIGMKSSVLERAPTQYSEDVNVSAISPTRKYEDYGKFSRKASTSMVSAERDDHGISKLRRIKQKCCENVSAISSKSKYEDHGKFPFRASTSIVSAEKEDHEIINTQTIKNFGREDATVSAISRKSNGEKYRKFSQNLSTSMLSAEKVDHSISNMQTIKKYYPEDVSVNAISPKPKCEDFRKMSWIASTSMVGTEEDDHGIINTPTIKHCCSPKSKVEDYGNFFQKTSASMFSAEKEDHEIINTQTIKKCCSPKSKSEDYGKIFRKASTSMASAEEEDHEIINTQTIKNWGREDANGSAISPKSKGENFGTFSPKLSTSMLSAEKVDHGESNIQTIKKYYPEDVSVNAISPEPKREDYREKSWKASTSTVGTEKEDHGINNIRMNKKCCCVSQNDIGIESAKDSLRDLDIPRNSMNSGARCKCTKILTAQPPSEEAICKCRKCELFGVPSEKSTISDKNVIHYGNRDNTSLKALCNCLALNDLRKVTSHELEKPNVKQIFEETLIRLQDLYKRLSDEEKTELELKADINDEEAVNRMINVFAIAPNKEKLSLGLVGTCTLQDEETVRRIISLYKGLTSKQKAALKSEDIIKGKEVFNRLEKMFKCLTDEQKAELGLGGDISDEEALRRFKKIYASISLADKLSLGLIGDNKVRCDEAIFRIKELYKGFTDEQKEDIINGEEESNRLEELFKGLTDEQKEELGLGGDISDKEALRRFKKMYETLPFSDEATQRLTELCKGLSEKEKNELGIGGMNEEEAILLLGQLYNNATDEVKVKLGLSGRNKKGDEDVITGLKEIYQDLSDQEKVSLGFNVQRNDNDVSKRLMELYKGLSEEEKNELGIGGMNEEEAILLLTQLYDNATDEEKVNLGLTGRHKKSDEHVIADLKELYHGLSDKEKVSLGFKVQINDNDVTQRLMELYKGLSEEDKNELGIGGMNEKEAILHLRQLYNNATDEEKVNLGLAGSSKKRDEEVVAGLKQLNQVLPNQERDILGFNDKKKDVETIKRLKQLYKELTDDQKDELGIGEMNEDEAIWHLVQLFKNTTDEERSELGLVGYNINENEKLISGLQKTYDALPDEKKNELGFKDKKKDNDTTQRLKSLYGGLTAEQIDGFGIEGMSEEESIKHLRQLRSEATDKEKLELELKGDNMKDDEVVRRDKILNEGRSDKNTVAHGIKNKIKRKDILISIRKFYKSLSKEQRAKLGIGEGVTLKEALRHILKLYSYLPDKEKLALHLMGDKGKEFNNVMRLMEKNYKYMMDKNKSCIVSSKVKGVKSCSNKSLCCKSQSGAFGCVSRKFCKRDMKKKSVTMGRSLESDICDISCHITRKQLDDCTSKDLRESSASEVRASCSRGLNANRVPKACPLCQERRRDGKGSHPTIKTNENKAPKTKTVNVFQKTGIAKKNVNARNDFSVSGEKEETATTASEQIAKYNVPSTSTAYNNVHSASSSIKEIKFNDEGGNLSKMKRKQNEKDTTPYAP